MNVAAATRATFVPDVLGSVIASVDSGSGTLSKVGYLPYGKSAGASVPFGFTGQRIDPETNGLYYYRARHYSPAWGRFLQTDPIGYDGGSNLYVYVGNDPLNLVDPSGLWQVIISGGYSLVGGSFTFGYNSGQWSVGAWLGVGGGLSVRVDPWNAPAVQLHTPTSTAALVAHQQFGQENNASSVIVRSRSNNLGYSGRHLGDCQFQCRAQKILSLGMGGVRKAIPVFEKIDKAGNPFDRFCCAAKISKVPRSAPFPVW